jgi:hypothetical protein
LRVELRLAQLRLEQELARRGSSAKKVSFQSGLCTQHQFVFGPETFVVKIGNGTTSSIARQTGFTAIRIEDATPEVSFVTGKLADDRDAIAARAVVSVANPARKVTEVLDVGQLLSFEHEIVISQPVKFSELGLH